MNKTGSAKGAPLLIVGAGVMAPLFFHVSGAVAPLFSHVSRVVITFVTLFVNGRGALPTQHKEKLQGDNLNLHFSRENFEGLE